MLCEFGDCEIDIPDSITTTTAIKIFGKLFEASFDGICIVGNDEIVKSVNSAFVNIVGRSEKELIGKPLRKLMPLDCHCYIDEWQKSDQKYKAEPSDIFCTASKGMEKNLLVNHTSMDIGGEITHFMLLKDVTSHESIKSRLTEAEENYNLPFEQAAIGMSFSSTDGYWLKVNNALCRILGYTGLEIIGMNFKSITHPDDLKNNIEHMDQMLKGTIGTFESEKRYFKKDGNIIWARVSMSLVRDVNNEPLYFFSQTEDITERKKTENDLLLFNSLISQSNDAILVVDAKTSRILDINERTCTNLGYTREEILRLMIRDIKATPSGDTFWNDHIAMYEQEDELIFESSHRRKDGTTFPVEISERLVKWEDKEYIVATVRDIIDRKKVEEALIQAKILAEAGNRTKSELVANVSHELRTPLNSIIGFSEVLQDETFGSLNEKQIKYVDHIFTSGKQLLSLINDLLDISKIEAGKMELNYTNFSISTVIDDVMNLVLPMLSDKGIVIEATIDQQIIFVNADIKKVKQVLLNLLDNAIKFTPTGGSIKIDVIRDGDMLKVAISDTGIGISEDDQKKLFQPFVQLDGSTTREYKGTGLGLVLVKQMIELHGGEVWIESEFGKGSTFIFTLPFNAFVKD